MTPERKARMAWLRGIAEEVQRRGLMDEDLTAVQILVHLGEDNDAIGWVRTSGCITRDFPVKNWLGQRLRFSFIKYGKKLDKALSQIVLPDFRILHLHLEAVTPEGRTSVTNLYRFEARRKRADRSRPGRGRTQ